MGKLILAIHIVKQYNINENILNLGETYYE
jgi:hypothetical protein